MPYLKHIPEIIKPFDKQLKFNISNANNEIYLTFDDGPHPTITPWVLDQLEAYSAHGTFFLVGENAQKYPELVLEIEQRGHRIGNHGQNHLDGWKTPIASYVQNVEECSQHVSSSLFRPPYGRITLSEAKKLQSDYKLIMWSDLSADFDASVSWERVVHHATHKVESGSIIVFHDSDKAWLRLKEALVPCLEFYQEKGFNMNSIGL